jgi:hypothetical protein
MTNTRAAFKQVPNTELPQRTDVQRASRQTSIMSHFEWLLLSRAAPSGQVGPCATGARDPIPRPHTETPMAAQEEPSRDTWALPRRPIPYPGNPSSMHRMLFSLSLNHAGFPSSSTRRPRLSPDPGR